MPTPTSHYTQAKSLRLHYLESGTPDPRVPPILLLHGFPTSSHLYRNILPELGKTHRAIALDLPGYGLSDKPLDAAYDYDFYADTLDAFLDALGIGNTHLCVHDLGGPVGLYWMLRHPRRGPKLILLNTLVYPETSWAVKLFLLAMKTPGLAKIARELPRYQGTLRLMYGENDLALPDVAKTMRRLQQDHPEARLTALPNCGHFLQEDEPKRVGQLIAEFLNTRSD
jgi:haloalkane dehalogenase